MLIYRSNPSVLLILEKTCILVSLVCREIAIKINIGKLQIHRPIEDLSQELQYTNIQILPILTQDIELYSTLNFPSNHRDPFDRMLIVQAINLSLVVISKDVKFDDYPIQRLWD